MRWDRFELGPVLDADTEGELRLAFDLARQLAVCLRFHSWVGGPPLGPIPQPESPVPHLVRVIELHVQGHEIWVERELCFGPTLETLVGRGTVDPQTVAGIAAQVLEGLRDLHQAGGAHGTLSPAAVIFDLTSGRIRLVDVENSRLPLPASAAAGLYHDAGTGRPPSPAGDLVALGRICEALLLGQPPLEGAPRSDGFQGGAAQNLWSWARRCQVSGQAGGTEHGPADDRDARFASAEDALNALAELGFAGASRASLPAGPWARRQAAALTLVEEWKRSPPQGITQEAPLSYGQLRSSVTAEKWWKRVAAAGAALLILSAALVVRPARGNARNEPSFGEEGCLERARPLPSVAGVGVPQGQVRLTLRVEPGTAVAVDGCPLASAQLRSQDGGWWVAPGIHELRAERGDLVVDRTLDLAGRGEGAVEVGALLAAAPHPAAEQTAALARLVETTRSVVREGLPEVADGGGAAADPLLWGMLEPSAQWLLAEDARVVADDAALRGAMPDSLALAFAGLRAARERFERASLVCEQKLRTAAAEQLASGQAPATPQAIDAAVLMAGARVASVQLAEPLRVEQRGLDRLGLGRNPRLNRAVDSLLGNAELRGCLEGLLPLAGEVDEVAVRVLLLMEVAE